MIDVAAIPRAEIPALLCALSARLLEPMPVSARELAPAEKKPDEDRWLTAKEAATLLRRKVTWIYRNSDTLPFVKRLAPHSPLLCSEKGIRLYLARR